MKKSLLIITATFLFAASALFSQSFSLTDGSGTPILSGATISISGDTGAIIFQKIKLYNNTSGSKTVRVKKAELSVVPGSSNSYCFAGQCYGPTTILSPDVVSIAAGGCDTTFEGEYKPKGYTGTSTIRYIFFNTSDQNDSVYVNVAYTGNAFAGIPDNYSQTVDFPGVYPNPVSSVANFSWDLPSYTNEAVIIIRDLLGSVVKEATIETLSGKVGVSVRDLPNGVYFYSLVINDKPYITRKMIIKH